MDFFEKIPSFSERLKYFRTVYRANSALRINCWQIQKFLSTYTAETGQFPLTKISELEEKINAADALFQESSEENLSDLSISDREQQLSILVEKALKAFQTFRNFHSEASELCRRMWTSFDTFSMISGLLLISFSLVCLLSEILRRNFAYGEVNPDINPRGSALIVCSILGCIWFYYLESIGSICAVLVLLGFLFLRNSMGQLITKTKVNID